MAGDNSEPIAYVPGDLLYMVQCWNVLPMCQGICCTWFSADICCLCVRGSAVHGSVLLCVAYVPGDLLYMVQCWYVLFVPVSSLFMSVVHFISFRCRWVLNLNAQWVSCCGESGELYTSCSSSSPTLPFYHPIQRPFSSSFIFPFPFSFCIICFIIVIFLPSCLLRPLLILFPSF
jgi:hypothetical protein